MVSSILDTLVSDALAHPSEGEQLDVPSQEPGREVWAADLNPKIMVWVQLEPREKRPTRSREQGPPWTPEEPPAFQEERNKSDRRSSRR